MKKLLALALLACLGLARPGWAEDVSPERNRAQIHTQLGAAYLSMGKMGVALDELNTAVKSDSKYAPAYNMLGLVYMELREFDKAEDHFQRALSIDPANSEAHNNYGWFLCQRNKVDEAIGHFMSALKDPLYTTPEKAYLNAGLCSQKKGDEKAAEDFFLRATRFQPPPSLALLQLGEINFRRANYADTLVYLERFAKISAPTPESLWLGVRLGHRLGNKDMEASYGVQLRKRFPDSRQAMAYRTGQFEESIKTEARP